MADEKKEDEKDLVKIMAELRKQYGADSIMQVGDEKRDMEVVSTGSFSLDWVLGCGGLPRGRIIELFGSESSGKSSMAMFIVGQMQKQGHKALYLDAECSFSAAYAEKMGVNVQELLLAQPTTGEECLKMLQKMVASGQIGVVIVDSVASLVPERELAGEITDAEMAQQARMMSKSLRMITGLIAKNKSVVIFINQLREKVGVFFGKKENTPGGKALKFYSSLRLEVARRAVILDNNKDAIGNTMWIKAVKNKVGIPFRECELDLYYNTGIDLKSDVFDAALKQGVITRKGNTYFFEDKPLGVGKEKCLEELPVNEIKKKLSYGQKNVNADDKTAKTKKKTEAAPATEAGDSLPGI